MKTEIYLYKGDNNEVLEKYKKIKPNIIYMDPPYNTWNGSLTYSDKKSTEEWKENFSILVKHLKRISQEKSVFFVSINDEELVNTILVLREELGKNSVVSIMPRKSHSGHKTSSTISNYHDFVVVATKGNGIKFNGVEIDTKQYKYEDEYFSERGKYQLRRIDYKEFKWSESLDFGYSIDGKTIYPGGVNEQEWKRRKRNHLEKDWSWIWSKNKIDFGIENGFVVVKNGKLYKKTYTKAWIQKNNNEYSIVNKTRTKNVDSLYFTDKEYMRKPNQTDPEKLFDYPKSDSLIKMLLSLPEFEKKVVLDPFGGTGTTAIMANEIGADEVHIIQLDEKTKQNSSASKAGYKSIFDLMHKNIEIKTERKIEVIKWK